LELNKAVPVFGAQLSLFPDVQQLQAPLQQVFKEYVECYAMMLQYASHPTRKQSYFIQSISQLLTNIAMLFQSFDDRIVPARTIFDESRQQWNEAIKKAQEEQKRQAASIPSFPRDSLGHQHPYYAPSRISFEWLETLGHGTYGQVSKVRQTNTGRVYAQKVISVADARLRTRIEKQVENEVSIMEKLHHLHIASLSSCCLLQTTTCSNFCAGNPYRE
jgi:Protein kinase domain